MTETDRIEWPREIWAFAIDHSEFETSGTYATSEFATVPRWDGDMVMIAFKAAGRQVAFRMQMADPADFTDTATGKKRSATDAASFAAKEDRRRWRALALSIKAKLVAVEDGIETFEQAFMAHIVMPDGLTIGQHVTPRIAQAYETGDMPPLLPAPGGD